MIWQHGRDKLEIFLTVINNHPCTIEFTASKDFNEIHFLGTIVYRGSNNQLLSRIYHTPTGNKRMSSFQLRPTFETDKKCTLPNC